MKVDKVRELDAAELQNQLRDSAEQLFRLKFQMSMGQTDGLKKYRLLRKDRARILTVLRERNIKPDTSAGPRPQVQATSGARESRVRNFFRRNKKGSK